LVLDVKGGVLQPGAPVIVWERKHGDNANQLWRFTPDGFIENVASGLVLDIEGGGRAGAKLIVYQKKHGNAENQRWRYDQSSETFVSIHYGLVLDVEGASRTPGAQIVAYNAKPHHDNSNQRFYFSN